MCKVTPCVNKDIYQDNMCFYHWKHGDEKPVKEKKVKPIAKASDKRKDELKEYSKEAKAFKKEHATCELKLEGCTTKTEDVHHVRGKENKMLLNQLFWKAACRSCHRKVTEKSKQAIEQAHSVSRHIKQ